MRSRYAQRVLVPAFLVAAAVSSAACDVNVGNGDFSVGVVSGKAQDEWTRSYTVKPGSKIEVVNTNGKIDVQPSWGPSVEVRAERIAKARSDEAAKAILEKLDIVESVTAEGVKLRTQPRERLSLGQQQEVRYHVRVPAGMTLDLETVNGSVELVNVEATVSASTTNGGVTARNVSGSVEATATNGRILLDLVSIGEGGVKAETVNGGVALRVPSDVKADLVARCQNGSINVDNLKLETTGERTRHRLDATINGGGPRIQVDTTNGGVRIASWRPEAVVVEKPTTGIR